MYKPIGFTVPPLATYLPTYAEDIIEGFTDIDKEIPKAIKSLGKETMQLRNIWWEWLLSIEHPTLDASPELKQKFLILLSHLLKETGFVDVEPLIVDYTINPVMNIDEVVLRMLGPRLPKFTRDNLSGDFATFETLARFVPEALRQYAIVLRERKNMTDRFRRWIGNIGYKLITGVALSQTERTAFVLYSNTRLGSPGYSDIVTSGAIPATDVSDKMVDEASALYGSVGLAGPSTSHYKLISNALLLNLMYYYGPHTPDLKWQTGFYQRYGPFLKLEDLTTSDLTAWPEEGHLAGMNARTNQLSSSAAARNPFAIRTPNGYLLHDLFGAMALYPDDPMFNLSLTNQGNCSDYEYDWMSDWRGERLSTRVHGGTMEVAIADMALRGRVSGACPVEHSTLDKIGIASYTSAAMDRIEIRDDTDIEETYLVPGPQGPREVAFPMTAHYSRVGSVEVMPPLSEYMEVPLNWFMTEAPRVVEYIAAQAALTADQKHRYAPAIAIYHNVARYTRLTGKQPPINAREVIKALLKL